jgi:hypothetical protein
MSLADDMFRMIRENVLPEFVPTVPNFRRVRESGVRNHLDELEVDSVEELELYAIETTGRGKMDDEERTERVVGGQVQGELVIMLLEPLLEEGDIVVRILDGEVWKVVEVDEPRLNNETVSHNYTIRRQTD